MYTKTFEGGRCKKKKVAIFLRFSMNSRDSTETERLRFLPEQVIGRALTRILLN